jgi:hypothetical protein
MRVVANVKCAPEVEAASVGVALSSTVGRGAVASCVSLAATSVLPRRLSPLTAGGTEARRHRGEQAGTESEAAC